MQMIKLLVLILLVGWSQSASSSLSSSDKYDRTFKSWSELYLPTYDWRILKAQCWQESRFRIDAVSPVGASGICQFMPATWDEVEGQVGLKGNPFNPELNIQFAAYYMSKLNSYWSYERPHKDRISLALASYNGGAGNLTKAQRLCGGSVYYSVIIECLEDVTGIHSKETRGYVKNIWQFYILLVIGY